MNHAIMDFVNVLLDTGRVDVEGKDVLDVGSQDVVGSIREVFLRRNPHRYVGLDIEDGPAVDVVGDAENLVDIFGPDTFDLVVSTEMLEHVRPWQKIVKQMAGVCKVGGQILWTTRSHPFPYHGYPDDCWRYETRGMERVLRKLDIGAQYIGPDPENPGVFVVGVKMGHDVTLDDQELIPGITEAPDGFGMVPVDVLNVWKGGPSCQYGRVEG